MEMKWTPEQQKVIELRERNILVSAAAGSGKTAVLVERIIGKLTRKEHPIDIDQLLIVTFTRAAAGEMRERLTEAVESYLEQDPENEHLQRQQTLIHNAQITTIDGFCSYVIRNYFHTIDLDPGFRTANEGEIKLLKQDVAQEVLEENYAERTASFDRFVESFATGKSDEVLTELILRMYEFAMSNPWPDEWLEACGQTYEVRTKEELEACEWMKKLWEDAGHLLDQIRYLQERCGEVIYSLRGPQMYGEALEADRVFRQELETAFLARDFDTCKALLDGWKPKTLSRKKDDSVDGEKRELAKNLRDQAKDGIKKLRENYFYETLGEVLEELELCREPVLELVRLTRQFIERFSEKKRQKNILDFTDMEHFALEILVKKEEGKICYTQAADEFSDRFEEILIDEYQDSNLVQETLLQSVSKLRFGKYNLFMVGDVKQSIYRFRLARPELFMEKYDTYGLEDGLCQRIDLHKNFRSRAKVLEGVNQIFYQIMGKDLGSVAYDADAALYPGAVFAEKPEETKPSPACEVLLSQTGLGELDEQLQEQTDQELEARMIGEKIRSMVGTELVWDKKEQQYRPARYQDCVILLRTVTGWAENFVNVLMDMGIPAYATSKTGYFSTVEVRTVLNYLRILDNPMQEIPFTGVLLSPLAGCNGKELAVLKARYPQEKIYGCVWKYLQEGDTGELSDKLRAFWKIYEQLREKVTYTPIHELVGEILTKTGYDLYAGAMPGGAQRRANLQMLVEKAMEYESTSYRGLFNFIRYVEQLQKYQVDFGEVNIRGEKEDTVRIMSIHKSKGLEFPIVFAAGMGKRFNMSDASTGLVIHQDLGIGIQAVDPRYRTQASSLVRQVIQKQIRLESLGEELRVLYVALTRAKEKLILTGTVKKLEDYQAARNEAREWKDTLLPYGLREGVRCYWDWILPALSRNKDSFVMQVFEPGQLITEQVSEQKSRILQKSIYETWDPGQVFDAAIRKNLEEKFSYRYPYDYLQEIPAKVSVSELKKQGQEEAEEEAVYLYEPEEREPIVPQFIREAEEQTLQGAARGTAYHRILECLDYTRIGSQQEIEQQIQELLMEEKISAQMAAAVRPAQICWFVRSGIGQRMKRAALCGKLHREQQFVMSIEASEKDPAWDQGEQILVQGIIDAFWEEADGLVLLDYKTDHVKEGQELIERYQKQMRYYSQVLWRVYQKPVKACYLYSFAMGKAVAVEV